MRAGFVVILFKQAGLDQFPIVGYSQRSRVIGQAGGSHIGYVVGPHSVATQRWNDRLSETGLSPSGFAEAPAKVS